MTTDHRAWIESRGAINVWDLFVWAGLNPKRISHDAPRKDRGDAPLYFLTYNRITAWVTEADRDAILASQPIPAAKRLRFLGPGHGCVYLGCDLLATEESGRCARHEKVRLRDVARREAWAARRAEEDAERERAAQARQRAVELVTDAGPLLEELGIRPDTVTVSHDGLVRAPAEVFDRLIRKAHEALEMEAL